MAKKLKLTKSKAQELLKNPPANQPMTDKQVRYFQAVAHGWIPKAQNGDKVLSNDEMVRYLKDTGNSIFLDELPKNKKTASI